MEPKQHLIARFESLNRVIKRADVLLEAYRSYITELTAAGLNTNSELLALSHLNEAQ